MSGTQMLIWRNPCRFIFARYTRTLSLAALSFLAIRQFHTVIVTSNITRKDGQPSLRVADWALRATSGA